jgi:hypothetical protein
MPTPEEFVRDLLDRMGLGNTMASTAKEWLAERIRARDAAVRAAALRWAAGQATNLEGTLHAAARKDEAILDELDEALRKKEGRDVSDYEVYAVRELGDRIGYGRMMQLAERLWGDKLVREGGGNEQMRGGAHSVGPCVGMLVQCVCEGRDMGNCDWCCGTGRVTRLVGHVQRIQNEPAGPK